MENKKISEEEFFDILKKNNAYEEYINLSSENQENARKIFMDNGYKLHNEIDSKYVKKCFEKNYSEVKRMHICIQAFIFANRTTSIVASLIILFNILIKGNSFVSQSIFVAVAIALYMISNFIENTILVDIDRLICKCKDVEKKIEKL